MKPPYYILEEETDTPENLPADMPEGWTQAWRVSPSFGKETYTMLRFVFGGGAADKFGIYTHYHRYTGDGKRMEICHGDSMRSALMTLLVNTNPPLVSLLLSPPNGTKTEPL